MFVIPAKDTKRFSQPNYGDTQGNLWASYNLNLTRNTGRIRTTRCQYITSEAEVATLGDNSAFAFYDPVTTTDPVFVAFNDGVYWGGENPTDAFVLDTTPGTPTCTSARGDLKVFNDRLYATGNTALKRLDHGDASWTSVDTLTSGNMHQMCVYGDRLYYVDEKNKIFSIDTAETPATTGSYTMDLSYFGGHISWIKEGSNRIWIGYTKNDGSRGLIFEWDGQSENLWSRNYAIEAQGSAGCAIWNDIPYVMDIEGRLLAFNGSNFDEVARLPILQYDVLSSNYATTSAKKIVHFNGIRYMNDAIYLLVDNRTTGEYLGLENFPAGVYTYTKENGLVHSFSPSLTKEGTSIKDYGTTDVSAVGAIYDATMKRTNAVSFPASVLFGAEIKNNANNSVNAIFTDVVDPGTTGISGYLITPWLESTQVTDVWSKVVVKYRKFLGNNAKIIVKYRTNKDVPLIKQNIVWSTSTTITDTGFGSVEVGDEIEVMNGDGAGKTAHIVSNVYANPNYTITLDSSVPGIAGGETGDVRFLSWKKLPEITYTYQQHAELTVPLANKDIQVQFKVVFEWENPDNEIQEFIVINNSEQTAK